MIWWLLIEIDSEIETSISKKKEKKYDRNIKQRTRVVNCTPNTDGQQLHFNSLKTPNHQVLISIKSHKNEQAACRFEYDLAPILKCYRINDNHSHQEVNSIAFYELCACSIVFVYMCLCVWSIILRIIDFDRINSFHFENSIGMNSIEHWTHFLSCHRLSHSYLESLVDFTTSYENLSHNSSWLHWKETL